MTINNNMTTNQINPNAARIASGQRINSAADDPAGLGIAERMTSGIRGFEQATRNVLDMQSLVNTAEGALSSITENLQRMRELAVQASNSIFTDQDRGRLQQEFNMLRDEIDATARLTQFNSRPLLDGGFSAEDNRYLELHTAADPAGRGPTVRIGNMNSDMLLGPEPFDMTSGVGFDISRIDSALSQVSAQRSYLGAMSNRFDTTIASNQIANLNLAAARSRIMDQDIAQAVMQMEQQNVIDQAQILAQRRQQEHEQMPILSLLA